jgi:hypothetical protein
MSKFFRPDHGQEQIREEQQRDNADDYGFHLFSYNFSQNSVYKALAAKNAMITPTKITSLILVSMSAT